MPRLYKILVLFLVSVVLALVSGVFASDGSEVFWGTFKYSFARTGYVPDAWKAAGLRTGEWGVWWNYTTGLCVTSEPVIGDLNGDGAPDAVFDSCDGYLYTVSALNGSLEWRFYTGGGFANPTLYDLDGDGRLEVLSVGRRGVLYCLDGSGKVLWSIEDRFFSGSPGVGDLDGDGRPDVVMGSDTGILYVRWGNGSVSKIRVSGLPLSTPSLADVDGDGRVEAVLASGPSLILVDYMDGGLKVYSDIIGHRIIGPVALYDIDDNGIPEAVFDTRDARVYVYSIALGRVLDAVELNASEVASPASVAPLTPGGNPYVIVGTMDGLYILYSNLTPWRIYPYYQIYTSTPIIADVDGDGHGEVLIGQEDGEFTIIDPQQGRGDLEEVEWTLLTGGPIMGSATVADVDKDGIPEIFIGSRDYKLYAIKAIPLQENSTESHTHSTQATTSATSTGNENTTTHIGMPTGTPRQAIKPSIKIIIATTIASMTIIALTYLYRRR